MVWSTHPDGVDTSALDQMLAGHQTIPEDRGLFLEETWRLHPTICAFTSELFYESRLHPRQGLELQEVRSTSVLHGAGLRYVPVTHTGNQSSWRSFLTRPGKRTNGRNRDNFPTLLKRVAKLLTARESVCGS